MAGACIFLWNLIMQKDKNKLVIISGYFKEESYGLLGPQMAATIISDHSDYQAVVVAVTNDDDKNDLKTALTDYFDGARMVVGFSSLGGRPDLFDFARKLKTEGAVTILAGPQAGPDYKGEIGWQDYDHRFKGLSDCFSFALQGPAQQILPILEAGFDSDLKGFSGAIFKTRSGEVIENTPVKWDSQWLSTVDWSNLYRVKQACLEKVSITGAQVLQHIGCQHAAKKRKIQIQYPYGLKTKDETRSVTIAHNGCSFCDVAVDKGYMGAISEDAVKEQLKSLPEQSDGSKIAFELINESPLPKLKRLMEMTDEIGVELSQVNLTMRADYLLKGINKLEDALTLAQKKNIRILLASIGFESFEDTILRNLNKGVTRQMNLDAIKAIRGLKPKFPYHFGYLKEEGANHGFIHPTPWDNEDRTREVNQTIAMYQLTRDILPNHSTPLIIHHASGLADWIRQIEEKESVQYQRFGTTIAWWDDGGHQ